jgi:hypothetical protein
VNFRAEVSLDVPFFEVSPGTKYVHGSMHVSMFTYHNNLIWYMRRGRTYRRQLSTLADAGGANNSTSSRVSAAVATVTLPRVPPLFASHHHLAATSLIQTDAVLSFSSSSSTPAFEFGYEYAVTGSH